MKRESIVAAALIASAALLPTGQAQAIEFLTQPVSQTYHNGRSSTATSVRTDSQGNMYASITSLNENGKIIKYNASGQVVWSLDFDPNNPRPADKNFYIVSTGISAVAVDRNDNVYAVGESFNGKSLDCLLKKYNSNGTLAWQTRYGVPTSGTSGADQYCHDITIDKGGDIIAGGTSLPFTGTNLGYYGMQLLKWDANGNLIDKFNATTDGFAACGHALPCASQITNVVTDLNQNVYVVEKTGAPPVRAFAKFGPDLSFKRDTYYSLPRTFRPETIAVDTQGHVFGNGFELTPNASGVVEKFNKLIVMDSDLNQTCEDKRLIDMTSSLLRTESDYFHAMIVGPDEKAYLAGTENHDYTILPYNAQCQPQWPAPMLVNVDYWDMPNALAFDANSNLIIAGQHLKSDLITTDAAIVKMVRAVLPTSSDLVISGFWPNPTATEGQPLWAGGYVTNKGTGTTGEPHWLGLYLSTDANITRQDILLSRSAIQTQVGGVTLPYEFTGTPPANLPSGTYYAGLIADDGNVVIETVEANNTAAGQLQYTALPDLVSTTATAPTTAATGQSITVSGSVKNEGIGTSTASTAGIYLSSDSIITATDTPICTVAVAALGAGASQQLSCTRTIPANLYAGNYYVGVLADSASAVAEKNEANNASAKAITLTALPDLIVDTAVTPPSAKRGVPMTVSGTVKNQGYAATGAAYGYHVLRVYLSTDSVITATDPILCGIGFGTTAANISVPFSCTATPSAALAAGTYYVGFVTDDTKSIVESNETNNIKINTITITQ